MSTCHSCNSQQPSKHGLCIRHSASCLLACYQRRPLNHMPVRIQQQLQPCSKQARVSGIDRSHYTDLPFCLMKGRNSQSARSSVWGGARGSLAREGAINVPFTRSCVRSGEQDTHEHSARLSAQFVGLRMWPTACGVHRRSLPVPSKRCQREAMERQGMGCRLCVTFPYLHIPPLTSVLEPLQLLYRSCACTSTASIHVYSK
jgi:hypothetical protein